MNLIFEFMFIFKILYLNYFCLKFKIKLNYFIKNILVN